MMTIRNIFALSALALAMTACDKIGENERYTEVSGVNDARKVLVEEFTGQFCPNCPLGHEALDNIMSMYPKNAVIVSIHAGDMAFEDEEFGLKTAEGDTYAAKWGIQQYPSAIVNRATTALSDRSQWQGAVFSAAKAAPIADIKLSAEVADGKINITSALSSQTTTAANYQLWITEDKISAMQLKGEEYIMDYTHNHVYRATVNGVGGESVILSSGDLTLNNSIAVNPKWNTANLNVVAFIYNDKGVLQAEEVRVAP